MLLALEEFRPQELCLIIDGVGPSELLSVEEEDQREAVPVQLPYQRTGAVPGIQRTLSLADTVLNPQLNSPVFLSPPLVIQPSCQGSQ